MFGKIPDKYDKVAFLKENNFTKDDIKFHMEQVGRAEDLQDVLNLKGFREVIVPLMKKIQSEALHRFRFNKDHSLEENGVCIGFERLQLAFDDIINKGNLSLDVIKNNESKKEKDHDRRKSA